MGTASSAASTNRADRIRFRSSETRVSVDGWAYRKNDVGKVDSVRAGSRGAADAGWERWLGAGSDRRVPMVAWSQGDRRMRGWTDVLAGGRAFA